MRGSETAEGREAANRRSGVAWTCPTGEALYTVATGDWRTETPRIDPERCDGCGLCFLYCPTGSIRLHDGGASVALAFCKGCGICATECPKRAVVMAAGRGGA